jgi:hypothetical protein
MVPVLTPRPRRGMHLLGALMAATLAVTVAACGGTASPAAATPSPTIAATPSPTPAPTPTPAPSVAASPAATADPAADLKIGAPYAIADVAPALKTAFETQMASGLGSFGSLISFGFRQISGGQGQAFLLVMAFPTGMLNDEAYQGALGGMSASLKATLTPSTVDGVEVSSGNASSGGVAVFHMGDHLIMVIAQTPADAVPMATALIQANK